MGNENQELTVYIRAIKEAWGWLVTCFISEDLELLFTEKETPIVLILNS